MKEIKNIDATSITSYEEALKYLKRYDETFNLVTCHNAKALIAIEKLMVIAEAWNKLDEFVPDYDNRSQYKYFPWFVYDGARVGFVFAYANDSASYALAYLGSRLCFSTRERAALFGKQFIDLWNDFLLLQE